MSPAEPCWILGFDAYDVFGSWADARLADAIEVVLGDPHCPSSARAWWTVSTDQYAFRWYVTEQLGRLLDEAHASWRPYIIGHAHAIPGDALPYVCDPIASLGAA